jgi:hypothetical protein
MRVRITILLLFFVLIALYSFRKQDAETLNFRFTKNYEGDAWENSRTGFLWGLSFLGAELPKGSFDKSVEWINENTFKLNFNNLGFSVKALSALRTIHDSLKKTEEYKKQNSVDLGEYIAITLGSSWHYYRITDVEKHLSDFKKKYNFNSAVTFPVTHSSVAKHHRILKLSFSKDVSKQAYIAEEGAGDIFKKDFQNVAFEAFDIMKNGQLRFAVYDKNGDLIAASPQKFSNAGKPAKCIWCHEIVIQPLFVQTDTLI